MYTEKINVLLEVYDRASKKHASTDIDRKYVSVAVRSNVEEPHSQTSIANPPFPESAIISS